jgi:hypothetical protein
MTSMRTALWIVLAAIALTILYSWIGLSWAPAVPLRLWPGGATLLLPQWVVPFGGLLLAAVVFIVFFVLEDPYLDERNLPVFALLVLAAAILIWLGVDRGAIEPLRGGLLLVLVVLTVASALTVLSMLRRGGAIGVRSHWGGLGNGLGGWQVLPATIAFLLTLAFLGATVAVAIDRGGPAAAKTMVVSSGGAPLAQTKPSGH